MTKKLSNVKKLDIQGISKTIVELANKGLMSIRIQSRTIAGNFWTGKFQTNETEITIISNENKSDRP